MSEPTERERASLYTEEGYPSEPKRTCKHCGFAHEEHRASDTKCPKLPRWNSWAETEFEPFT